VCKRHHKHVTVGALRSFDAMTAFRRFKRKMEFAINMLSSPRMLDCETHKNRDLDE
jgi:hypothetical protein